MTRNEFIKKRWRAFELIEYAPYRKENIVIECMLISVDFEQELFKIEPINKDMYDNDSFWVRIEYCKRPTPKLRKINN